MMELWGRANSVNVQKAIWVCEELGLPYRRIDAGGAFGVVDTRPPHAQPERPAFPALVDGDPWMLWESHAIIRYLAL